MSAAILAGVFASSSCRREERNFHSGGPSPEYIKWNRTVDLSDDPYAVARGPQNVFEKNAYALSEGKRLFSSFNCVGCHAAGGGDIGPPLKDAKWLYGAMPQDIYSSILDGRPNGMPAFRGRITDTQAKQLASYVRSLSGQAKMNAATGRDDHMKSSPENSAPRENPRPDDRPKQ